ncbi:MAG: hypothetical protein ACI8RZ_005922 [Myxococcota bacterium]|jgi:hypothetical protein
MKHLAVLFLIGCTPRIRMEVLQPADIYVPQHIQQIAVVDRSRASSAGEAVLGAIEAVLTGEDIGADRMGRSEAVSAVTNILASSPRFEIAQVTIDGDSGLFADSLDWKTARRLCPPASCQGIVALEALDSDSSTRHSSHRKTETDSDGRERSVMVHEASQETWVLTAWRFYDVEKMRVIDDLRDYDARQTWSGEGRTKAAAISDLPSQSDAVRSVSRQAGEQYARRVAPTYIWVTRTYYGRRDEALSAARPLAKVGSWNRAAELWEPLLRSEDPTLRGKALYNLALQAEVAGDLQRAAGLLDQAAAELPKGRIHRYQAVIYQRIADQAALQEQLPDGE